MRPVAAFLLSLLFSLSALGGEQRAPVGDRIGGAPEAAAYLVQAATPTAQVALRTMGPHVAGPRTVAPPVPALLASSMWPVPVGHPAAPACRVRYGVAIRCAALVFPYDATAPPSSLA